MWATKLYFTLLLSCGQQPSGAQEISGTLLDAETKVPVRNAILTTNRGQEVRSDIYGKFTLKEDFDSVSISHGKYMRIWRNKDEMTDTLLLLPRFNQLAEVVVIGHRPRLCVSPEMLRQKAYGDGMGIQSPSGIDILSVFRPKERKRKKRMERIEKMLEDY